MTLFNGQLKSSNGYIPTEVLSEIFLQCLDADAYGCTITDPLQAPLVLSWVCQLWRNVAINTHRLWTGVIFVRKPERIIDSTHLLELWIARSGALPFGVKLSNVIGDRNCLSTISNRIESDPLLAKGIQTFIDTLLTCSKRWRVLELIVPEVSVAAPLLQALVRDSPGLEHFGISSQYIGIYEAPTHYDFSLNTALQTVRLITPLILPLASGSNQIFASLTSLELHFCASIQDCLTWLDTAPNLEHLVLRLYSSQEHSAPRRGRCVRRLPHLEFLEVTCFAANSRFDDPGLLLDVLELPALNELELDLNYLFDATPWPHVGDLLVRSGASLEGLVLSGTPMSEEEVVECLRLSPHLQYLDCATVTDNVLLALTPRLLSDNTIVSSASSVQVHEQRAVKLQASDDRIEVDNAEGDGCTDGARTKSEDLSKYTVMCPSLKFFESNDVDVCSLQVLYTMMCARCEDVYEDIREYVDQSKIHPTPAAFKTLNSIVLPCDPLYGVLSHPHILNSLERTVYF